MPRADLVFALDDSRTTLVLSLVVRGKRKTGWVQGISLLYAEGGFFDMEKRSSLALGNGEDRLPSRQDSPPEDKHDAEVELELLDLQGQGQPLASYRSEYASPPATRPTHPISTARPKPVGAQGSSPMNNGLASSAACYALSETHDRGPRRSRRCARIRAWTRGS